VAHSKESAATHKQMLGPFKTIDTILNHRMYDPAEVFSSFLKTNVGQFNAIASTEMWPIPRDQQHLSCKMLGPFKTINSTFRSRTYDPSEVFGSFLKNNVGHFNAVDSIPSSNNVAHSKESAAPLMQYAGPNREHWVSNSRAPLAPFDSIDKIFESTTGSPAEVFGSFLKRNVGHFNDMASIF
jgi:hypothetical protein